MCRWRTARNYLAGLVVGDGSLTFYKKTNSYYIEIYDADKEFLEDIVREIRRTLKINARVTSVRGRNYSKLRISNKELYNALRVTISKRLRSPTKAFVRGIIDAEGTIYLDKKGRISLEIANVNKEIIDAVCKYLKRHGIHHRVTVHKGRGNRKTIFKVRIRGWGNVEKTLSLIKPKHPKIISKFMKLKTNRPRTP